MKSIGSLIFIFGIAAIVFGFMNRAPVVLNWIYDWGETTAWVIKIGLVVVGAVLYFLGAKKKQENQTPES